MPLDFHVMQAPFRFGIDEGVDPKQQPFGAITTCENLTWLKSGRLQKRAGIAAASMGIAGGGTVPSVARLFTRDDELCLVTNRSAAGQLAYTNSSAGWRLIGMTGRISDAGLSWEPSHADVDGIAVSDASLTTDGQLIQAWITGMPLHPDDFSSPLTVTTGQLQYQITDVVTGARIQSPVQLDSAQHPRRVVALSFGTDWVLLWDEIRLGANILRYCFNGTMGTLASITDATGVFDARVIGSSFVVGYAKVGGGLRLHQYSFAVTPVLGNAQDVTGEAAVAFVISLDGLSAQALYVGYGVETSPRALKLAGADPSTLVQTFAPILIDNTADMKSVTLAVTYKSASVCQYTYSTSAASTAQTYRDGYFTSSEANASGLTGPKVFAFNVRLLTRPFLVDTRVYALTSNFLLSFGIAGSGISGLEPSQGTYLVDLTPPTIQTAPRYVGRINTIDGGFYRAGHVMSPIALDAHEWLAISPNELAVSPSFAEVWQGTQQIRITFGSRAPRDFCRGITVNHETYLNTGVLSAYDGRAIFDALHASNPILTYIRGAITGGAMAKTTSGAYIYQLTSEYRSSAGIIHRGPVSAERSATIASGNTGSVQLEIIQVYLSQKIGEGGVIPAPTIPLFRTVEAGTVPQRLTIEPRIGIVYQLTSLTSPVGYLDQANDSDIDGSSTPLAVRSALYTQGGELEDMQPPAFLSMTLYKGRLFGIAGDRRTIWFSKSYEDNLGTAPGFNPAFRIVVNDMLVALAVLDERLILFSKDKIYVMAGDGPAVNGDGDFGSVSQLQTDNGCSNPRSIASIGSGVVFESSGQIYLLTRKLEVSWIGKRIRDHLAAYPNITSAVVVSDLNQLRISCTDQAITSGVVLVWNYVEDQWSVYRYGADVPIIDALMHNGVYTFATPTGVFTEDRTTHLDAGVFVASLIETAWIYAEGPLGYQSVRAFQIDGLSETDHGLSISVGFNGGDTYLEGPRSWPENTPQVTAVGPIDDAKVTIGTRRKCRSIRFKIQDSAPVTPGTGAGPLWTSMAIEVGQKRGLGRLAIAAQE